MGVSVFTDYLIPALSLTRVQLSTAYMVGTIASSLLLPWAGTALDRMGARKFGSLVGIALGLLLIFLGFCDQISLFLSGIASFLRPAVSGFATICIGFFLLRFLGQGCVSLASRNMLAKWFDRRRGFASGISAVFVSFGFSLAPVFLNGLIGRFGWKHTWHILGLMTIALFLFVVSVFFRDNPEECGLKPDGSKPDSEKTSSYEIEYAFTRKQAMRTSTFWIFNIALAQAGLFSTAFTFHVISIFKEAGHSAETAVAIFFPSSVIAVILSLLGGWLSDHTKLKYLLSLFCAGMTLSTLGFLSLESSFGWWLIVWGSGVRGGMMTILWTVAWPRFFGRAHLGEISGYNTSWMVFFSALGPVLFGLSLEKTGSYSLALWMCLAAAIVLLLLSFWADKPKVPHPGET